MESGTTESGSAGSASIAAYSAMGRMVGRWRWPKVAWAPFACLLLLVCGVYVNSLRVPFLLDDRLQLLIEPTTHSWSNAVRSAYGRRFGMLTFAANYAWGRTDVIGYHAVNVAIHLMAGCLLWALARRLLRVPGTPVELSRAAEPLAWTIAALWMLHPLQTNAVTYTIQRFESLASLGMLAALYAVARHAATGRNTGSGIVWGALAVASGWMATQSKEISIGLPVLSVALSRAFFADSWKAVWRRQGWIHGGLAVASALLFYQSRSAFVAGPAASAGFSVEGLTPWIYLRSQPAVILHYLRLTLWPDALCLDYGWPVSDSAASVYGLGAVILGLLGGTAYACVRAPRLGFLGLAFFTVLAPTSSFVPIADLAFEHRMYLPLASVAALGTLVAWRLLCNARGFFAAGYRPRLVIAAGLACAIVGALAYRTWLRNEDFRDPRKLWLQCIARNPRHVRPRLNLGQLLNSTGQSDAAIREYEALAEFAPDCVEMHSQWGAALRNRGDLEGALRRLENAVRLSPSFLPAWHNLAAVRLERKEYAQAADGFRRVVALSPRAVEGWSGLGWSVELMGEHREAADCYRRAMKLDPSLIVVPTRLAELLATTEDVGLRDPVEALRLVELANRRTGGKNPYVLAALAAAQHANRNSRQAIVTAENALRTARDAELRDRLKTRLRAYRQENGPSVTEEPVTEDQVNKKLVNTPSVDGETAATDMGGR